MITLNHLESLLPELKENYCHLHQHPELGFDEWETSAFILKKLAEYGIEGRQVARTGVIATIAGHAAGKTVAIRADIDALPIEEQGDLPYRSQNPGKMHACGHDAHTVMLLCAAKYLAANREAFQGNVRLIFQPAEEGTSPEVLEKMEQSGENVLGGAVSMIACGALEGVDACFSLHINPTMPLASFAISQGRATASSDVFEVTIQGKGGHGSTPESAIDSMGALAAIIAAYNAFPAREISALDSCALSIGAVHAGKAWNVIPDSIFLTGGVRAFSQELRGQVFARLEEIARGICAAYRCDCLFLRREGYAPTINQPEMAQRMYAMAQQLFGADRALLAEKPITGSEDVGYYFQKVPGAIGWLGAGVFENAAPPHNPLFQIPLESLGYGALFHVNMALDILKN